MNDTPERTTTTTTTTAAVPIDIASYMSQIPFARLLGFDASEHPVVLQWICYHIGFPRKPDWLRD